MGLLAMVRAHSAATANKSTNGAAQHVSKQLVDMARYNSTEVMEQLNTASGGLTQEEAERRLARFGANEVAKEKRQSSLMRLLEICKNPLVILLLVLASLSLVTEDTTGAIMMLIMVVLGVSLRYFQEQRADQAAEKLKAMVTT